MSEWEYAIVPLNFTVEGAQQQIENRLSVMGRFGWELVSVSDGRAYMKRLIVR